MNMDLKLKCDRLFANCLNVMNDGLEKWLNFIQHRIQWRYGVPFHSACKIMNRKCQ